jgi:hypothetical protein
VGVESAGWRALQHQSALVQHRVVAPADQGQILEVRCAAVDPLDEMMGVTPFRGPVASG